MRAPRRDHNLPSKMLDSTALSGAMNGGRPFWLSATSNASAGTSSPMSLCPPPTSSPPLLPWFHLRHPPQGSEGVVGGDDTASFRGPEEDRLKDKALTRESTSNGCASLYKFFFVEKLEKPLSQPLHSSMSRYLYICKCTLLIYLTTVNR